jgi:hypothetical protein
MYLIQQITNDPLQEQTLLLPSDNSPLVLTLYYAPLQYAWNIKNLVYGDFQIQNLRITVSPNMLFQFKNQIPFGIACYSTAAREPTQQNDFQSGAARLFLLGADEVQAYADFLQNG